MDKKLNYILNNAYSLIEVLNDLNYCNMDQDEKNESIDYIEDCMFYMANTLKEYRENNDIT